MEWKEAFASALRDQGYSKVVIVDRGGLREYAQLVPAAEDLVREKVDVIVAYGAKAPAEAARTTKTIPIIIVGGDPVPMGLAKTHSRPGGNVTAISARNTELYGKQLELLREFVPKLKRVAVLLNPESATEVTGLETIKAHARLMSLELQSIEIRKPADFESAFAAGAAWHPEGLLMIASTLFIAHRERIATLALKYNMPSVTRRSEYVRSGLLASYGPSIAQLFYRAGGYAARVLKGQSVADLPVDQAAEFELVVNEKTARMLGLGIPSTVRLRATVVQ